MFPAVFFFQAEDGIRDKLVTGVQTCALPISPEPVKANPAAGLQGAAAPRGECWQRGRRLDGRRRHSLLESQAAAVVMPPPARPPFPLPSGRSAALHSGPS